MTDAQPIYRSSESGALRQGEVVSGVVQFRIDPDNLDAALAGGRAEILQEEHPFAIVVTQDCDLDWDHRTRQEHVGTTSAKLLPNVLMCELKDASEAPRQPGMKALPWTRIVQNKEERYQFLQAVTPDEDAQGIGLPELLIDFKRYFTIPTDEVYGQLERRARRRCVLMSPYLEHLATRFHYFQYRVALPGQHKSE